MTTAIRSEATRSVVVVNGNDRVYVNSDGSIEAVSPPAVATGNQLVSMGQSKLSLGVAQPTTSGTSINFTGIPSWVKRITLMLNGVSTKGTSNYQIQLGHAGGLETTGYASTGSAMGGGVGSTIVTTSFLIKSSSATTLLSGALTISCLDVSTNVWVASGAFTDAVANNFLTSGIKPLSGTLDRIRLTTVNGTDVFDAGSVNIMWE